MYVCMYTERQKKLITSSVWRSLKFTLSKLIIFGHREAEILLNKNIWKPKVCLQVPKRRKFAKLTHVHCYMYEQLGIPSGSFEDGIENNSSFECPGPSLLITWNLFWIYKRCHRNNLDLVALAPDSHGDHMNHSNDFESPCCMDDHDKFYQNVSYNVSYKIQFLFFAKAPFPS